VSRPSTGSVADVGGRADPAGRQGVDCAVVVVTYHSARDLPGLLASVPGAAPALSVHVTVVDNASSDGVEQAVHGHEGVSLIRSHRNLGYAGAINVALDWLPRSRWVLVLNPDLVLAPGALTEMVRTAERTGAAAVVPKLVDGSGRLARSLRREPSVLRVLGEALLGDHLPRRPGWASEIVRDPARYERGGEVEWATGAAVLLSRSVLERTGAWDDRFFLYSEETDYCRRLRRAGHRIRFEPAAVVQHRGGGSGSSPALVALLAVNRVRYFRKWHGVTATSLVWTCAVLHSLLRARRPGDRAALAALVSARARRVLPGSGAVPPVAPTRPGRS
jgi:GT2 family glycosyltransferase